MSPCWIFERESLQEIRFKTFKKVLPAAFENVPSLECSSKKSLDDSPWEFACSLLQKCCIISRGPLLWTRSIQVSSLLNSWGMKIQIIQNQAWLLFGCLWLRKRYESGPKKHPSMKLPTASLWLAQMFCSFLRSIFHISQLPGVLPGTLSSPLGHSYSRSYIFFSPNFLGTNSLLYPFWTLKDQNLFGKRNTKPGTPKGRL